MSTEMKSWTVYNQSLYNTSPKSQVINNNKRKEDSSSSSSFPFLFSSTGSSAQSVGRALGNYSIELSPYFEKNACNSLNLQEKRRKRWGRHFAQKHFQQVQFAHLLKAKNSLEDEYNNVVKMFLKALELRENTKNFPLPSSPDGVVYYRNENHIDFLADLVCELEEKLVDFNKKLTVLNHSAGLCGERPIPKYAKKKKKTGEKRERYETNCPGHVEVHTNYMNDAGVVDTSAHYVYLRRCGSVWFCPNCAETIFRKRRDEIEKAFDYYKGKTISFVTLTIPHGSQDFLPDFLKKMSKSLTKLKSGKAWKSFKERYNFGGEIRTTEITYSQKNGFHPHYHLCFFFNEILSKKEVGEMEIWIKKRWHKIIESQGFIKNKKIKSAHKTHGCVIKTSTDPVRAEYLSKTEIWEMASTTSKTPRRTDSISHWELQRLATEEKVAWATTKWTEFMLGMRGRIAIWWSHGLKEKVGADDLTDEKLLEGEKAEIAMIIEKEEMKVISSFKKNCCVLDAVENYYNGNIESIVQLRDEIGIKLEIFPELISTSPPG